MAWLTPPFNYKFENRLGKLETKNQKAGKQRRPAHCRHCIAI